MIKRQLEQRRARRRKLNDRLNDIDETLTKKDYELADKKNDLMIDIAEEMKGENVALDTEHESLKQAILKKFDKVKQEKLADYLDRLRNAGGSKDFQKILSQYEHA